MTEILLMAAVLVITAVVFAIWLAAGVARLAYRGVMAVFGSGESGELTEGVKIVCPRRGCLTVNPVSAKFCRRCGQELLKQQVRYRHAALI